MTELKECATSSGDTWIVFTSKGSGAINFSHATEVLLVENVVYVRLLHQEKPIGRIFDSNEKAQAFYDWICSLINVKNFEDKATIQ